MKETLQTLGRTMLMPLAVMAIGSVFMGLGGAFTSQGTVNALGLGDIIYSGSTIYNIFFIMKSIGKVVFANLPILYAAGVAFGMSKKEQGWAAFSAVLSYIAFNAIISSMFKINDISAVTTAKTFLVENRGMDIITATKWNSLYTNVLGYFSYRTGIFGGLIIGLIVQKIHNRFYNVKLPMVLSFFAGTRTVPILSLVAGSFAGIICYYVWPTFGLALAELANFISRTGLFGTYLWAMLDKSLLPLGLHHLVTIPLRWTELGGTAIVDGNLVVGTSGIQMAQLGSSEMTKLITRNLNSGRAILHLGSLPGAALAIYHTAKPEQRTKLLGILMPAVLTMILFGITEPLEFTFLFVAPWLFYLVHVPLTGLAFTLAEYFKISIYGSSIKDWLPQIFQFQKLYIVPYFFLVPLFFTAYYFAFRFLILKYNVKTPGREDEDEVKLYSKKDYLEKTGEGKKLEPQFQGARLANDIIMNLGGKENIESLDNCISRLRVIVKDPNKVSEDHTWKGLLKASGIVRKGNALQIIYGVKVQTIAGDVREILY
ncbi:MULTISPECIES: PTS transporter subunit EIIC [Psychrilyobacter]|uniref:PTS glucose transporter subunit IIBC n=1 Tax=Psychrilyobacter piezotolerans TaxID=2293438 RepID=A0ABX9KIV3_9FUSO|nr:MULTISPECIES: PTS transporter subunit EIIC [Psychrilyobacter]MCS5420610.1 PTS transporter subunit EIIC [Psychrilyobacter sp. S5]NDI77371.1 PTS transporter subunit EIIC [Psychrilyobacter piezotolerans]RDE63676.1 PTS glucose transporter subunit IIBC [Psychrilyobacter sp. S5]REI42020.1 PTS glucose transporter subunit IIBC [Psychrilyobacter piezotolerans]